MAKHIVYADFNCPFCYALDVRLASVAGDHSEIDWRVIQHVPEAEGRCQPTDHVELASEVYTVRHRAPEVPIRLPGERPASGAASRAYAALSRVDAARASRLRHALYEALWVHGRDISDPATIESVARAAGVTLEDDTDEDEDTLRAWQKDWKTGPYDQRIPVIVDADERALLGLSSPEDIAAFLDGGPPPREASAVCHYVPRESLMVVGEVQGVWPLLAQFTEHRDVRVVREPDQARIELEAEPPDALIIRAPKDVWDAALNGLAQAALDEDVPVVVVDASDSESRALAAYRRGVSEYLSIRIAPAMFQARLEIHLSARRKLVEMRRAARLDPVTRVATRAEFDRLLALEWRRATRSKLPISVVIVALERSDFQPISDPTLRAVAAALESQLPRPADLLARWEDSWFVALLPNTGQQRLDIVVPSSRRMVRDVDTGGFRLRCRIGAATGLAEATTASVLLRMAVDRLDHQASGSRPRSEY